MVLKQQSRRSVGAQRGVLPAVLVAAVLAMGSRGWTGSLLEDNYDPLRAPEHNALLVDGLRKAGLSI